LIKDKTFVDVFHLTLAGINLSLFNNLEPATLFDKNKDEMIPRVLRCQVDRS